MAEQQRRIAQIDMTYGPGDFLSFSDRVSCVGFDLTLWNPGGGKLVRGADDWLYRQADFAEVLEAGDRVAVLGYTPNAFVPHPQRGGSKLTISSILGLGHCHTSALTMSSIESAHRSFDELQPPTGHRWNSLVAFEINDAAISVLEADPSGKCVGQAFVGDSGSVVFLLPALDPEASSDDETRLVGLETLCSALLNFEATAPAKPPPHWLSDVQGYEEADVLGEQRKRLDALHVATAAVEESLEKIAEIGHWKQLLYETGTRMEDIADQAYELLGFELLETVRGKADHRMRVGNLKFAGETKGKKGGATMIDARQLNQWVDEEAGEVFQGAKGIFLVNGFFDIAPSERPGVFTGDLLKYCEDRRFCCVTGPQLYDIVQRVLADPTKTEHYRNFLIDTVGVLELDEES